MKPPHLNLSAHIIHQPLPIAPKVTANMVRHVASSPTSGGMGPVKWFVYTQKVTSETSFPICVRQGAVRCGDVRVEEEDRGRSAESEEGGWQRCAK